MRNAGSPSLWRAIVVGFGCVMAVSAFGQTFSIDYQGPTAGSVNAGDILVPTPPAPGPGPLPPPSVAFSWSALNLVPGLANHLEIDALSFGKDLPVWEGSQIPLHYLRFSVDEFAIGRPGQPTPFNTNTEGLIGSQEASADIFANAAPLAVPVPALPAFQANIAVLDGDGMAPWGGPGLGLVEPNNPAPFGVPDLGDNLDAYSHENFPQLPIFFSLDAAFADPLETVGGMAPPNTGAAVANGFVGGDVLMAQLVGFPVGTIVTTVYAPALQLGLDLQGPDTDDLDALLLWDDGDFEWNLQNDALLFSVRRGSAVVGVTDPVSGLRIEEGDILAPPLALGQPPQIMIPGEAIGVATVRAGFTTGWGVVNPVYGADIWADDLDALGSVPEPTTVSLLAIAGIAFLIRRRRRG